MKKLMIGSLIGFFFSVMVAFASVYEPTAATAEVEQLRGLYIFTDSKPVLKYEYLGTVKNSFSLGDSQYTGVRDRLIRKAKKDYPQADAVIITFKTGGKDTADAIKFKD